ncbi:MAG: site-specific tyrosine recombinase/integron integrase [Bacteroidales bacterium]
MLTKFQKYLRVERNYSVQTIRAYGDDLRQFFAFYDINPSSFQPAEVTHRMVRGWLSSLLVSGNTPRTVNRKLSSLRSFYKFLKKNGLVQTDPIAKVVAPKASKKLPSVLKTSEVNFMIDDIKYPDGFLGLRDLLIMELFYFTGVRVSELVNLKTQGVDLESETIKVMGKGSKERIIPMHPELKPALKEYTRQRQQAFPLNNAPYLIVTNKGEKTYSQFIYRVVKKYLSLVTMLEKKSPHVLRHTFATHLLDQGANIDAIKELLGHASLSATQVYTHTSIQKLKSAYQQAHPRA